METLRKLLIGLAILGTALGFGLMAWLGPRLFEGVLKAQSLSPFKLFEHVEGTLAPLKDGRLLLAGQQPPDRPMSAELYDPETGVFSRAENMNAPRSFNPLSIGLKDGRVLVMGGFTHGEPAFGVEAYDPAQGQWKTIKHLPRGTRVSDAVALGDGAVLLVTEESGEGGLLRFDPETGDLRPVGHPSYTVNGTPLGTPLKDGKVLISHLEYGDRTPGSSNAFLFDPASGSTRLLPRMAQHRSQHQATLMKDGRVLITGGAEAEPSSEIFDPATEAFSAAGPMVAPRSLHLAVALPDGRVLIVQGVSSRRSGPMPDPGKLMKMSPEELLRSMPKPVALKAQAEVYDPRTNTFTALPDPPSRVTASFGSGGLRGYVTHGGEVLFFTQHGPLHFVPATNTWRFPWRTQAPRRP